MDIAHLRLAAQTLLEPKRRSYELMALQPGMTVLDVGCGPGTDTLALAELVGKRGVVYGVDDDAALVAAANQRAELAGVSGRVLHHCADAAALPWRGAMFDAVRCERLFEHVADAPRALAEVVRVTRSGGSVVVLDIDWASFSVDTGEPELDARLALFHLERMTHPFGGLALHRLCRRLALRDLVIETWTAVLDDAAQAQVLFGLDRLPEQALQAGAVDDDEASRWRESLARARAGSGRVVAGAELVLVAGAVP